MPPKPKFTREQIVTAAYELALSDGTGAVVARAVGKKLGTTSTPIFTFFDSMEELKNEVYLRAKADFTEYVRGFTDYFPSFKEFGLRTVRYAAEKPNLFRLLFFSGIGDGEALRDEFSELIRPAVGEIRQLFSLSQSEAEELLRQMLILTDGVADLILRGDYSDDEARTGRLFSSVCVGLVAGIQLKNGTFDEARARKMIAAADKMPVPKYGAENNLKEG